MTLVSSLYTQSVYATTLMPKCDMSAMLDDSAGMDCESCDLDCLSDCFNSVNANLLVLFSDEPSKDSYRQLMPAASHSLSSATLKILSPPPITG